MSKTAYQRSCLTDDHYFTLGTLHRSLVTGGRRQRSVIYGGQRGGDLLAIKANLAMKKNYQHRFDKPNKL